VRRDASAEFGCHDLTAVAGEEEKERGILIVGQRPLHAADSLQMAGSLGIDVTIEKTELHVCHSMHAASGPDAVTAIAAEL
jgi:hypothetical protein